MELALDSLALLNTKNASTFRVSVRFANVTAHQMKQGKANVSIFCATLVDKDGNYCGFERNIFGSEKECSKQGEMMMLV